MDEHRIGTGQERGRKQESSSGGGNGDEDGVRENGEEVNKRKKPCTRVVDAM